MENNPPAERTPQEDPFIQAALQDPMYAERRQRVDHLAGLASQGDRAMAEAADLSQQQAQADAALARREEQLRRVWDRYPDNRQAFLPAVRLDDLVTEAETVGPDVRHDYGKDFTKAKADLAKALYGE